MKAEKVQKTVITLKLNQDEALALMDIIGSISEVSLKELVGHTKYSLFSIELYNTLHELY